MLKKILFFLLLSLPCFSRSAEVRIFLQAPEELKMKSSGVQTEIIGREELESVPGVSLDEKISALSAGLNVSRPNGIYSYKTNLSLRGFSSAEQGRVLILLDGMPLNVYATGSVNWNMLSLEEVERVEIFRGAGSFLYGSNAVAGMINIVTKKPSSGLKVSQLFASRDTALSKIKGGFESGKIAVSLGAAYLNSPGYVSVPPEFRNNYTVKKNALERDVSLRSFYRSGTFGDFDTRYVFYDGIRGEGSRIMTAEGTNRVFTNNLLSNKWSFKGENFEFENLVYYQNENYSRLYEYYKGTVYTRIDSEVLREDMAVNNILAFEIMGTPSAIGLDYKNGKVNGEDSQLAPFISKAYDKGKIYQYSPYFNLKKTYLENKLSVTAGFRYDKAVFYDGFYSNQASGWTAVNGPLEGASWDSFSPKFFASFKISPSLEQYFSYGKAFRPAALEDMCLSLLKGVRFSAANPSLKPEKTDSYETGLKLNPAEGVYVEPDFYLNKGKNFIYEINTGATVNINGIIKPVYMKENVSEVRVYGAELPLKFFYGKFSFYGNWAYSMSRLEKYPSNPALEGKELAYSPKNQLSALVSFAEKKAEVSLGWKYKSKQFTDDANTQELKAYPVYSAGVSLSLSRGLKTAFSVENIFDRRYMESSSDLAPGRVLSASLEYSF